MCRLVETIKLQNKQLQHIEWHNRRFNEARRQLYGVNEQIDLQGVIKIPETLTEGIYKCRILYGIQIENIEIQPYIPRNVRTLKLLEDNEIDYTHKYENRQALCLLLTLKSEADDILIVKNGCITDTSFSNVVFFDGEKWITPDTFLLNGTQRQRMLSEGVIRETRITPNDLKCYSKVKLINAMLDFETTTPVKILTDKFYEK